MIKRLAALLLSTYAVSTACFATKADGYECSKFVGAASLVHAESSGAAYRSACCRPFSMTALIS